MWQGGRGAVLGGWRTLRLLPRRTPPPVCLPHPCSLDRARLSLPLPPPPPPQLPPPPLLPRLLLSPTRGFSSPCSHRGCVWTSLVSVVHDQTLNQRVLVHPFPVVRHWFRHRSGPTGPSAPHDCAPVASGCLGGLVPQRRYVAAARATLDGSTPDGAASISRCGPGVGFSWRVQVRDALAGSAEFGTAACPILLGPLSHCLCAPELAAHRRSTRGRRVLPRTRCAAMLWPCPRCRAGGGRAHRAALRGFALLLEEEARPCPICLGRLCHPVRQQGVWCAR